MQQVPTGPRVAQNEESLLALAAVAAAALTAAAIYLSCSIAIALLLPCPFSCNSSLLCPDSFSLPFLCLLLRLGIVNVDPIWAAAHKKAGYEINAALWQATLRSLRPAPPPALLLLLSLFLLPAFAAGLRATNGGAFRV